MPSVIVETIGIDDIVRVFIVDEVFNLFAFFFLVLVVFLVVDLGFDIEEGSAAIFTAFSSMALDYT